MPGTKPIAADVDAAVATAAAGIHRTDLLNGFLKAFLAWTGGLAGKDTAAVADLAPGSPGTLVGFLPSGNATPGAPATLALGGGLGMDTNGTLSATATSLALTTVKTGPTTYVANANETVQVDPTAQAFSVRLPDRPPRATVDEIIDVSATGASATHPVTILPGGTGTVMGNAAGQLLDDGTYLSVIYDDAANDWREHA